MKGYCFNACWGLRTCGYMAVDWLWILGAVCFSLTCPGPLPYFLTMVVVGARQHAIAIHLHDGCHYLLFKDRRLNDLVARLLMEWPLFASLDSYRVMHRGHHRYLNTELDPDWVRNQPQRLNSSRNLLQRLLLLSGLPVFLQGFAALFLGCRQSTVDAVDSETAPLSPWLPWRLAFYVAMVTLFYLYDGLALLFWYWVLPYLCYFLPVMRYRGLSEHWAVPSKTMANKARTVLVGPFEAFFFYPKHINFHVEHHSFPSVPFYHLPALHRELMQDEQYRQEIHLCRGSVEVVRELLGFGKKRIVS